jgi:hypothetical protein
VCVCVCVYVCVCVCVCILDDGRDALEVCSHSRVVLLFQLLQAAEIRLLGVSQLLDRVAPLQASLVQLCFASVRTRYIPAYTSAYVSIREHTSLTADAACARVKRQHTSAYVCTRQHTYVDSVRTVC